MLNRNYVLGLASFGCVGLMACGGRSSLNDFRDGVGIPTSHNTDEANSADASVGDGDQPGDGDGDNPTGDGDGDNPTGDGDGDNPTGDGDGDQPGDGDGDQPGDGDGPTGDGDGDQPGDGDGDTPGDGDQPGDGDGDTPGDGDGDGPAAPGEVGGACEEAADCVNGEGQCLTTVGMGMYSLEFKDGYCVTGCESSDDCPSGSGCLSNALLEQQGVPPACVVLCSQSSECREGYECAALPTIAGGDGTTYCLPPLPALPF